MKPITPAGIAIRILFALVLVLSTYNPSGYSYYHWAESLLPDFTPILGLAGVILVIGWVIYIRATLRSLGPIGLGLAVLFLGFLIWMMIDWNWINLDNPSVISWIISILISIVLGIGMSWSHIRRRLSGQVDSDDVDDN